MKEKHDLQIEKEEARKLKAEKKRLVQEAKAEQKRKIKRTKVHKSGGEMNTALPHFHQAVQFIVKDNVCKVMGRRMDLFVCMFL